MIAHGGEQRHSPRVLPTRCGGRTPPAAGSPQVVEGLQHCSYTAVNHSLRDFLPTVGVVHPLAALRANRSPHRAERARSCTRAMPTRARSAVRGRRDRWGVNPVVVSAAARGRRFGTHAPQGRSCVLNDSWPSAPRTAANNVCTVGGRACGEEEGQACEFRAVMMWTLDASGTRMRGTCRPSLGDAPSPVPDRRCATGRRPAPVTGATRADIRERARPGVSPAKIGGHAAPVPGPRRPGGGPGGL